MEPSKPRPVGKPKVDIINITWNEPKKQLEPPISYQVRYKNVSEDKWILHREQLSDNYFKLENLPSGAEFIFKVRMTNDNDVGPWSLESDKIGTVESAAYRMFSTLVSVPRDNVKIAMKRLPFTEDKTCRNEIAKTRKFTYGKESGSQVSEKIILMLGQTGAGKSTLVNGMINYIFGVSWGDSFRLTVENLEADELKNKGDQARSQTKWITCYTIYQTEGTRIPYKLTIIDTPGYGESFESDQAITEQIRQLFEVSDKTGIVYLDAICFVIKASDARLTPTQEYIFNSIQSLFQKDIIDNFCMMITFADGNPPEVLSALKAGNLQNEHYFAFNNSALFADNLIADASRLSRYLLDWNMGRKAFEDFFEALDMLNSKSLALSKEILAERKRIEITVENMQYKLKAALQINESLEIQIKLMKDTTETIERNKNHTFLVTETTRSRVSTVRSNLNCKKCKYTCHRKCWSFNYNFFISGCDAFDKGLCTQCDEKCSAEEHINEKYEYKLEAVQVSKTYKDIRERYEVAAVERLTHEKMIFVMEKQLKDLDTQIEKMIETITKSKERIKQIALRDDPLSAEEQFDIWIKEEETNKKDGWLERVKGFIKFKKHAQLNAGIEQVGRGVQRKIKETVNQLSTLNKPNK